MKKNLLTASLFVFVSAASAQNNTLQSSVICESSVATGINQFTSAFGHKTNLWYDKDVDALSFVYVATPSSVGYAYSLNHGSTWQVDTVLYNAPSLNEKGRYPQGAIYNPTGNTNPSNSYVTCFGMTSDTAGFNGFYEGTTALGSGVNQQTHYTFFTSPQSFVPQGGTIIRNTHDTWWSAGGNSGLGYNDTIVLAKGTFGGGNFSYNFFKLHVPVCTDNHGNKMYRNQAIIFDDSGQLGYVVVIGNDWACNGQDSAMGLIIFKTSDGGNTWGQEPRPNLSVVDNMLLNNGSTYSSATQLDLAMDQNDVLHIGLPVIPFMSGNIVQINYPSGSWGLFDFSVTLSQVWNACLITKPQTYHGDFGTAGSTTNPQIQEENRFQISRSWDGSKLFYTWFDTDTNTFGPGLNNFPDARSVGLDLLTNLYTPEIGLTEFSGTNADGSSLFGNVSYYTINDGTDENIPIVFDVMISNTGQPVNFFYIGCAAMNNYIYPGNCIPIFPKVQENNFSPEQLSVLSPYPNPFSGKTSLDISLAGSHEVTINITNAIGQVFYSATQVLGGGKNRVTINASALNQGLYFLTVNAGTETVTKMMSVE